MTPAGPVDLNPLQLQILAQVASGDSNGAIARSLGYSPSYVKDVVAIVRAHLRAHDRAHAASLAVALGLVRPLEEGRFVPTHLPREAITAGGVNLP
ncbi:MAG TPA: LuxR C-terminal-related transcriptional regulator [Acidimicrobiales bacterium]|nr:LuxR C-terminal-related transcriptional regulator [Acidimicrobiales bacterium]